MTTPGPGGGGSLGNATGTIIINFNGQGIGQAQNALNNLGNTAQQQSDKVEEAGREMATVGAVITGGFLLSVRAAANFEQQMSKVASVSGASAGEMELVRKKAIELGKATKFSAGESGEAIEELIKAGLTVSDVLDGAADATVNLAAAGEISLPAAAQIASNAMNAFSLSAQEMPRVADLIAGAANASAIDVSQFGMSLSQVGAVANLAGIDFKDTAAAIALMGNAGIKGSDAGTSLKTMLGNLNPVTDKQIGLFKELGIITEDGANKFHDAQGNMKGLADVAEVLNQAFDFSRITTEEFNKAVARGVDPLDLMRQEANKVGKAQRLMALETAFGSDSIRAAAILAKNGAAGFNAMATSMGKVSAADVAAEKMDNLMGSLEELKGSFETLMIVAGTPFLNMLRDVVDGITTMVNVFMDIPAPIRNTIVGLTALVGGLLLLGGAIIATVAKLQALKAALLTLAGTSMWLRITTNLALMRNAMIGLMATAAGPWVAAFAAAAAAIGALLLMNRKGKPPIDDLTEAIKANGAALNDANAMVIAKKLNDEGLLETAEKYGITLSDVTAATFDQADAQARFNAQVERARKPIEDQIRALREEEAAATRAGQQTSAAFKIKELVNTRNEIDRVASKVNEYTDSWKRATVEVDREARATKIAADNAARAAQVIDDRLNRALAYEAEVAANAGGAVDKLGGQVNDMGVETTGAKDAVKALNDAFKDLFDQAFGMDRAKESFQKSMNAIIAKGKEGKFVLKGSSDAVFANREMLRTSVEEIANVIGEMVERKEPVAAITTEFNRMRDQLYATAGQAGRTKTEVQSYIADALKRIPLTITTELDVNANQAIIDAARVKSELDAIPASVHTRIDIETRRSAMAQGVAVPGLAQGGIVKRATLAVVGEGRDFEAVLPLSYLERLMTKVYKAGQTNLATAQSVQGAVAPNNRGSSDSSGSSRLVSGSLSIDPSGRAYIRGMAEDVYDGNERFATAHGRMG